MSQPDGFSLDSKTERFLNSVKPVDPGPTDRRKVTSHLKLGLRLHGRGDFDAADACLKSAYLQAIEHENLIAAERCALARARAQAHLAPRKALSLLQALRATRSDILDSISTTFLVGTLLHEFAQPGLARETNQRLLDRCSNDENKRWSAFAREHLALNLFDEGNFSEARRYHKEALERLSDSEEQDKAGLVLVNMAVHANLQGRYDESLDLVTRSRAFLGLQPNLYLEIMVNLTEGMLGLSMRESEEALDKLLLAEKICRSTRLPAQLGVAFVWRSVLAEDVAPEDVLISFVSLANDNLQKGLVLEGGLCLLQAGCWARSQGLPGEAYLERGHALLGGGPGADLRIAHYTRLMDAVTRPRRARPRQPFPEFLTEAPEIIKLKSQLKRLVDTDVRVLLEGESGTGKSFLARQFHLAGKRKKAPFVTVDCTNLEENLFESKLFGHLRGAFTGAVSDHVGLVEQANNGTLFLDEIGEVPVEIQAKLLYTIEEQRYRPVGAKVEKRAEFRVVAATNRDIDEMLECGSLRRDLFFRLAGYRVVLPPLRERPEDIGPLVEYRLAELNERYNRKKTLRSSAWSEIAEYAWPGNVRELNSVLERGFHLAHGRRIGVGDLGLGLSPASLDRQDLSWYSVRRKHLLRVLRLCRGNVSQASKLLGINRTTLIYKLKLLDIERKDFDPKLREDGDNTSLRLVADADDSSTSD